MLFIVNSRKLTGFSKCSIGLNVECPLWIQLFRRLGTWGNSLDSGQPIKWNHGWEIARINVKFCVWAKKSIIQGQLMWKRSGSFSWLLSKIHVQQINLFSFLGIHFTTGRLCLKLAFYGLFVYMYTWISVYNYPLLIQSSFYATYFLKKDLTFVPFFF